MDEFNLTDRFSGEMNERMPLPRKKKRKTIPGTGMEKPKVRFEDEEEMGFGPLAEGLEDEEEDLGGEENPFDEILKDMQGGSASERRAKEKRKKAKANPRRFGDVSLRAEFLDRM